MFRIGLSKEKEWELIGKVRKNGLYLKRLKASQNEVICLEAVKQNGLALEFVKEQTEEICLEAVKERGAALQYVNIQTEEICLNAVKQNGYALEYVNEQTSEICMEAMKQCGWALEYVKEQTPEICLEALRSNHVFYCLIKHTDQEIERVLAILDESKDYRCPSYRQIRSQLVSKEIDLNDSPYHVLEQLYSY